MTVVSQHSKVLSCTSYAIRHDASSEGFLRNWELRGSEDGKNWTTLSSHVDDKTITRAHQYGSWRAEQATCTPLSVFRIVLTGPNSSRCNPYRLSLSWFELYGYLEV